MKFVAIFLTSLSLSAEEPTKFGMWRFETVVGQGTEGNYIRIHAENGQIIKKGEKPLPFSLEGVSEVVCSISCFNP